MIYIKNWSELATDKVATDYLEQYVFPAYFNTCRWFAGKARAQNTFQFQQLLPVSELAYIALVEVTYHDGEPELYQL
ncbi:MAG: trehalose synthase, partial [Runella slithyformis]